MNQQLPESQPGSDEVSVPHVTDSGIVVDKSLEKSQYPYDAFISYRHVELDQQWAKWLHTALETYRPPKELVQQRPDLAQRVMRVFRDEEELTAGTDLPDEIEKALRESGFLIVVCSLDTPESEWVNKEVLYFRELGGDDRILPLLIDGEPSEAYPAALQKIRHTTIDSDGQPIINVKDLEPVAADVRTQPSRRESQRYLRRMAKLKLLARLLDCRFDNLRQREQERQTRRQRRWGALASLLLVIMAILVGFAVYEKSEADSQRGRADKAVRKEEKAVRKEETAVRKEGIAVKEQKRQTTLAKERLELARRGAYNVQLANIRKVWVSRPAEAVRLLEDVERCPPELREFVWGFYHRLLQSSKLRLKGHTSRVNRVAFSPDGETLASAGGDTIRLWQVSTGRELSTLDGHDGWVQQVAFSPDGKMLASAGVDKTVKLWDTATNEERATLKGHSDKVVAVTFSPDGKSLVSSTFDGKVRFWETETGRFLGVVDTHFSSTRELEFSPDGTILALVSSTNGILLWDPRTHLNRRVFPTLAHGVAFAPDSKTLAIGGAINREEMAQQSPFDVEHSQIQVWEVEPRRLQKTFDARGGLLKSGTVTDVDFSPDGKTLASAARDGTIRLWNVDSGHERTTIKQHSKVVTCVAFSPDGRVIASGSEDLSIVLWNLGKADDAVISYVDVTSHSKLAFSEDGRSLVAVGLKGSSPATWWDLNTGLMRHIPPVHSERPSNVATLSEDRKFVACAYNDATIKVWETESSRKLATLSGHADLVRSLAFSPDQTKLVSTSDDGTIRLWNISTGQQVTIRGHDQYRRFAAFSPDGKVLATAGGIIPRSVRTKDGETAPLTTKLWDVAGGRVLATLTGYYSPAFSLDGKLLATAGVDNEIKLWDVATARETVVLGKLEKKIKSIVFFPGNLLMVLSGDATITLWDVAAGKQLASFQGDAEMVFDVVLSPDGRTLASAGVDRTIKLWDPRTGQQRTTLAGHTQGVVSLAFSADGKTLASASRDGTIGLWKSDYSSDD